MVSRRKWIVDSDWIGFLGERNGAFYWRLEAGAIDEWPAGAGSEARLRGRLSTWASAI
jgi:hypothetical protein